MKRIAVITVVLMILSGCGSNGGGDSERPEVYATPQLVSSTLTFTVLETSGAHTCGVASDGSTYCWGTNEYGELGSTEDMEVCTDLFRESYSCTGTPHLVDTPLKFIALAGSFSPGLTCGLTAEGDAYCWGFGIGGQLGDGQGTHSLTPVAVAGGLKFGEIRARPDGMGVCGITVSNDLYCWGSLGLILGTGDQYAGVISPWKVETAQRFISFDLGQLHACGVNATGQAYCWGNNWYGQLGVGSAGGEGTGALIQATAPTEVVGGHLFRSIVTGSNQTCALTETGEVYCWGAESNIGSNFNSDGYVGTPQRVEGELHFVELYAGFLNTCGLTAEGDAYCWGGNTVGELGDGTRVDRRSPVKVQIDQTFVSLSHRPTCGLTAQGQAYCWGGNYGGQVGRPPFDEVR